MAEIKKTAAVDPHKDLVEVELFKDNDQYKDDVFVAVNGHTFQIQRGVPVKVPRYVKEVLDNSRKEKVKLEERLRKLTQEDNGFHRYTSM